MGQSTFQIIIARSENTTIQKSIVCFLQFQLEKMVEDKILCTVDSEKKTFEGSKLEEAF